VKSLENLRWVQRWVSHLGCVKGCLNYLGIDVSDGWLYGGTGHAFVLNMSDDGSCPSGPTAWNHTMLTTLGTLLGYRTTVVAGSKHEGELEAAQERAWEFVRRSIDDGTPCYGWELDVPEYYVIFGYDETGYRYTGPACSGGSGTKPWRELGDTGIGLLEVCAVTPSDPADDATTVRAALTSALEMAGGSPKWVLPDYVAGLAAYDVWIRALEQGASARFGFCYNAEVWAECGGEAASLCDEALGFYNEVSESLEKVRVAYPFSTEHTMDPIAVDDKSREAVANLGRAREAEEKGLAVLARIVEEIDAKVRVRS